MSAQQSHPYFGQRAILTSKHEKVSLIQPEFSRAFNLEVRELPLDTDLLGTFSGEIERTASPLETAIKKARLGMQASGISLGIASEGSIGADPAMPLLTSDIELLVLVDDERGLVISETFRSFDIFAGRKEFRSGDDISEFLSRVDFPNHHLIVLTEGANGLTSIKGISNLTKLNESIEELLAISPKGFVVIESDFRANHSPSRQVNIQAAAKKLAKRIATLCPECAAPGWGVVDYERGVECSGCGDINPDIAHRETLGCVRCSARGPGKVINESIDSARCFGCNP
jgi:hypothetical protein